MPPRKPRQVPAGLENAATRRGARGDAAPAGPAEPPLYDWQWFVLAAAIPLLLCARKLNLDLWFDESYTIETFVSRPFTRIATSYPEPNNHVCYSLLLRPFYLLSESSYALRFPSLLCTAGTLFLVFRLGRRFWGRPAAALATLTLGLTQMFLVHTMQVRGYSLSMLLAAWLAERAMPPAAAGPSWRRLVAIALLAAAFVYTLPTNLLFLAPLGVAGVAWAGLRTRSTKAVAVEVAAWSVGGLLGVLCYAPILQAVLQRARESPASAPAALEVAGEVYSAATRDSLLLVVLLPAGLASALFRAVRRPGREQAALPLLLLAMLAGPFLLAALAHVRPFARNYSPILPFVALAFGWLLAELGEALRRLLRPAWLPSSTAAAGMLVLGIVLLPKVLTYPARLAAYRERRLPEDAYYVYSAAEFRPSQVVGFLERALDWRQDYLLCFTDADQSQLGYYLARSGIPYRRTWGEREQPTVALVFVVASVPADYAALARKCGLPADVLRGFPLVADFGYYRVYRSQKPMKIPGP